MTANHPYPAHVVEAVARGMYADDCQDDSQLDPNAEPHPGYYEYAQAALEALWDASRVEHLSEVEPLPNNAILRTRIGGLASARTMKHMTTSGDYPAHVLHWGNHDR